MNERIVVIRKYYELSQDSFGEKLGVTGATISRLEKGDRNLTNHMIKSICREFNVDYMWLTTGKGKMLNEIDNELVGIIDKLLSDKNDFRKILFEYFAKLSEKDWEDLERLINKFIEVKGTKKEDL